MVTHKGYSRLTWHNKGSKRQGFRQCYKADSDNLQFLQQGEIFSKRACRLYPKEECQKAQQGKTGYGNISDQ